MFDDALRGGVGFKPDNPMSIFSQSTNQAKAMFPNHYSGSTTSQPQFNENSFGLGLAGSQKQKFNENSFGLGLGSGQQQGGYWNSSFSPNPNPLNGESQNAFMSGNLPVTSANRQGKCPMGMMRQLHSENRKVGAVNGNNGGVQGRFCQCMNLPGRICQYCSENN